MARGPARFTLATQDTYETPARYSTSAIYGNLLQDLLPDNWRIGRTGVWLYTTGDFANTTTQGFKIHISSTRRDAEDVLRTVVPKCAEAKVDFKIAADPRLHGMINSKRYGRAGAGKFITMYPRDTALFKHFIEDLYVEIKGQDFEGPYILSDRQYKDSNILFYRYGGFSRMNEIRVDGRTNAVIHSPTGEAVEDRRVPYFRLPEWVNDPFERSDASEGDGVLQEKYEIESALGFSSAGGIYLGKVLPTGQEVIVKEARPHISFGSKKNGVTATEGLNKEYRVLKRLRDLDFIPDPIDLFEEWEHTFLVMDKMYENTFGQYWAKNENILSGYAHDEEVVEAFAEKFRPVALSVIDVVERVHEHEVIIGDISPNNILVDQDTQEVALIDLESASLPYDSARMRKFSSGRATPGFSVPKRHRQNELSYADDYYAVGMLLYHAIVPCQSFFILESDSRERFINRFIELGVPREFKTAIWSLLENNPAKAKAVLDR